MATLKSKRNRIFPPDDTAHFPELQDGAFMDELAFEIDGIMAQQAVLDTVDGVVGKDADFESKHPRGLPGNAGEFAPVGGPKRAFEKAAGHWHSKILDLFPGTPGNPDPRTQTEEWQNVYYAHPAAHQIGSFNRKVEAFVAKFPETGEMVRQWAKEVNNLAAQVIAEKAAPKPPTKREVAATERKEKVKALAGLTAMVGEAMAPSRDQFKTAIKAKLTDDLSKLESDLKAADWDFRKARPFPATNIGREAYILMEEARRDALRWVDFANPSGSMKGPQPCTLQGTPSEREARLESKSNQLADESYQAFTFKLADKIAEAAGGKEVKSVTHVSGGDVWGWSTLRAGLADGSEIRLETKQIINVSCLGKLFNQWPTRVAKSEDIAKYNPDQPRVPAGSAQGGEFVSAGAASAMAAGADSNANITISEDHFYGNKVQAGNREIRGRIGEPYPLPEGIPAIPKDDAIYMGPDNWGNRHVIDVKGRMVYELAPGTNLTPEPAWGSWKLKYRSEILAPQDEKPLPAKSVGSAAWADSAGLSRSKGSAFDKDLSAGHFGYGQDFKMDGRPFSEVDKFIGDKGLVSASVQGAMRQAGRLEAAALSEPVRLPPVEKMRRDSDYGTDESKAKLARDEQLDRWLKVLNGKTRGEALTAINREYVRLRNKQDANYNKEMEIHDALIKAGKEEDALQQIKEYFHNDIIKGKRTALFTLREAVRKDLIDRLVPSGYGNDVSGLKLSRDMTSSVDTDERNKVESGIHQAAVWLADHLHPSAFNLIAGGAALQPPRFDIRYPKDKDDRAFHSTSDNLISLRPDSGWDTVVHEYGHRLDTVNDLNLPSYDFMRHRGLNETVKLNRLTGYDGYKDNEEAHPDRFTNAYVGKEYGGRTNEVTSMGLQMMATDPSEFYQKDREHFLYTMYIMRGGR